MLSVFPVAQVIEDRGEGTNLVQAAGSRNIEAGKEGGSQVFVLETQTL